MNPPSLVVDASVAAKWFLPEAGSDQALSLLSAAQSGNIWLYAPDLLCAETGNIVWQRTRRGEMDPAEARGVIQQLVAIPLRWVSCLELARPATDLGLRWGCTVYDATYLALAEAYDTKVVTADRRLAEMVPENWRAKRVLLLDDFSE